MFFQVGPLGSQRSLHDDQAGPIRSHERIGPAAELGVHHSANAPPNSVEKPNDFNCHKSFAPLRLMGLATQSQGLGMPSRPIILNRRGPNAEYGF